MDILQGARIIVEDWLKADREEVLHFITDHQHLAEAKAFEQAAENIGAVPKTTILPADEIQYGQVISEMKQIMSYSDAIVGATTNSFVTSEAVDYVLKRGSRFLSLPLSTNNGQSIFESEFLKMDPKIAEQMAKHLLKFLHQGSFLRITTKLGTDISFSIVNRNPGFFSGLTSKRHSFGSSSFEVYIPVIENSAQGTVVLDGSLGYLGAVTEPFHIEFSNGSIASIETTTDGVRLKNYLESFSDCAMYYPGEFGIGLNSLAQCNGSSYIEDESTFGTCHIGFGRNLALGGVQDAAGHFDIVICKPNIYVDEQLIIENGVPLTN